MAGLARCDSGSQYTSFAAVWFRHERAPLTKPAVVLGRGRALQFEPGPYYAFLPAMPFSAAILLRGRVAHAGVTVKALESFTALEIKLVTLSS